MYLSKNSSLEKYRQFINQSLTEDESRKGKKW